MPEAVIVATSRTPIGRANKGSLAEARPDLVTYVPSAQARHTREWNVDPQRWEDAVRRWLPGRLAQDARTLGRARAR